MAGRVVRRARWSFEAVAIQDLWNSRVTGYVLRRLLLAAFVVWGAVTVIFLIVRVVPGDPASMMLGPSATEAQIATLRARLGLDLPLINQYAIYLANAARFDFGDSLRFGIPAAQAVAQVIPATASLGIVAMALALMTSVPLGIVAARSQNSVVDRLVRLSSLAGQSLPTFWVGLMLLLIFARSMRLLPSIGDDTPLHYILPAVTLAIPLIGTIVLLVRGGLLDVLNEGYIQTARSKGLSERTVVLSHAVPNMLIPVVTVVGLMLGDLLGGLVLVETVFAWPGLGRLTIDAIHNRDYPVVQACVAVIALIYVLLNLGVDLLYGRLDPRVRVAGR
jgi:ABC-type dipeptide/oligopeptide/nickel transport system permease component